MWKTLSWKIGKSTIDAQISWTYPSAGIGFEIFFENDQINYTAVNVHLLFIYIGVEYYQGKM